VEGVVDEDCELKLLVLVTCYGLKVFFISNSLTTFLPSKYFA
jgi:hypothetical protein